MNVEGLNDMPISTKGKMELMFAGIRLLIIIYAVVFNQPIVRASVLGAAPAGSHETQQKLNITVDPRIELLSVVQLLSGYVMGTSLINTDATSYRRDLDVYFADYRGHTAVKLFTEMYPQGFSFDAPPNAMLYLSNPPELNQLQTIPEDLKKRAGGEQRLLQFIDALRDFARATKFMAFYSAHLKDYQRMVDTMSSNTQHTDLIGELETYYGMKQHSYNIMLMPLAIELGYGVKVPRGDGTLDLYQMIGRSSVKEGLPVFGAGGGFTPQNIVWHEFSHSFVNPLTEKYREEVMKYASLYAPVSERMKEQAYTDWEHVVNEHIIRALTSRLAAREISQEAGERELREHKNRGFAYVEALAERLKEYESQRSKYPTFADFYPRLIEVFREIQEKNTTP